MSQDNRRRAAIEGRYGSTANLAHWALPQNANGTTDYYVWWSHGGYNADPGDHVAALSGWTGIEVALGSGPITAASRASSTISAINGAGAGLSASGDEAGLIVSGDINAATCAVGTTYTSRGTAGLFGNHTSAVLTNGNPFNDAIAVHGTFTAGPAVLTAIGVLLGTPAGESVRIALYTGGTSSSFVGTTLVADGIVSATDDGSGNVYAWLALTAAQSAALADNASIWLTAKTNAGGTLFPAFSNVGGAQEDWTNRNLVIFSGIDTDPTVAWPSTLEGEPSDIDTGNAVVMMGALEYRTAPYCGDCSLGGTTTSGLLLGIHDDAVLTSEESSLTSPDPLGANVSASLVTPAILGMLLTRSEVGVGTSHTDQFRLAEYLGASVGNPDGATLLQDHALTTGTATSSWVGIDASPEVAIAASTAIHMTTRGNGGISIRFASPGNEFVVSPADNPSDFATSATDEYETASANTAHSTDPTDVYETPFATHVSDITPDNYPARRLRYRVAGDTVTA